MSDTVTSDLTINIGATFQKDYTWLDSSKVAVDLSAYEARMQIRETRTSETVLLELTTANGRLILEPDSEAGKIRMSLGATVTELIEWTCGVYDLEIYDPLDADYVRRLIKGDIDISSEVTRA